MDIKNIAAQLENADEKGIIRNPQGKGVPDRKKVIQLIKELQSVLFPQYYNTRNDSVESKLSGIYVQLKEQIDTAYAFTGETQSVPTEALCEAFIEKLPQIKKYLLEDIVALYNGDPAAKCHEEVLICYPGFYAISIYRLAHELYMLKIPLLARIMTEYAHEKTGIDIHAGATIGRYFFIDHGTGIVIGETTVIGDHVKLYQGVTLGAKSFELDEDGNPVKDIKRHPNIGNHVVIYANATILGGRTFVGDHCVIGGNVWLTHSVDANQTVYYEAKKN